MRKLRSNSDESLDLLLDTLCNVFGGIILISCLLALLTNHRPSPTGDPTGTTAAQGRLLAERLAAAKSELAGLKKINETMKPSADEKLLALVRERDALLATQERLRKLQPPPTNSDTAVSKNPVGDLKELRSEVKAVDQLHEDAKARKEAADQKARDLAAQIQSLLSKVTTEEDKHTEHVRFPKERAITKPPYNVLLKYGALYPLQDASGEKFAGLKRVMKDDESFEAIPIESQGIPITNVAVVRRLLASYKHWGGYVSLNVYPDSFETFRALKTLIIEEGLDYGFEVCPQHYIIIFSRKGTSPAPL
ncbi:hypothetical protein [Prosthecobacter sp.]|uniref:hypothetical protein n=1 Tax=Prosthecobacter sp. TaxID=1965333 RepID=UPI003783E6D1